VAAASVPEHILMNDEPEQRFGAGRVWAFAITLQELQQLVRPLQSLLPPTNPIDPTLPRTTDHTSRTETPTKAKRTKGGQPAHSENKLRKTERSPKKK
jgi:hypothetical protein